MSERANILFVCSSALHLKLFAPAINLLASVDQIQPVIVSLDRFYEGIHGNVALCSTELQLSAPVIEAEFRRGESLITRIWSARKTGVRAMKTIFIHHHAKLVVFGNDTGHAERAALHAAKSLHIPTLLVQDGFLFDQFPAGWWGTSRLNLNKLWLAMGGSHIGAVPYGMGGCEVIATHSSKWLNTLHRRKCRITKRIEITGHPALAISANDSLAPFTQHDVSFFCTNFLSGHKDATAHQKQLGEILSLHKLLIARYGANTTLHVKLHPADQLEDYIELTHFPGINLYKDATISDLIQRSWLCITNISSATLDCLTMGRICLMSGISMQNNGYHQLFASLPGIKFVSWNECLSWLDRLDTTDGYKQVLELQHGELAPWIGQIGQGGTKLAALILQLSRSGTAPEPDA